MEMRIVPVWALNGISQPFDPVIGLLVISSEFFSSLSLLEYGRNEVPRKSVAVPDVANLGDEVLCHGAKPGMEGSELGGGEEHVSCVLLSPE